MGGIRRYNAGGYHNKAIEGTSKSLTLPYIISVKG